MTKNNKVKTKKEYVNIQTPVGIISYPYLAKPDTGRAESSNKYSAEIYIPKPVFAKEGKDMVEKILKVAREFFKNPKLKMGEFKGPITDMDATGKPVEDWQKGTIRVRAKATQDNKPTVIGPRKDEETGKFPVWSDEQVAAIKGGDHVRLICGVYGYTQQGGGIALGLNFVQFAKEGKALGQGRMKQIEALDEIEVTVDSPADMVDTEDSEDSEDADPMMTFA